MTCFSLGVEFLYVQIQCWSSWTCMSIFERRICVAHSVWFGQLVRDLNFGWFQLKVAIQRAGVIARWIDLAFYLSNSFKPTVMTSFLTKIVSSLQSTASLPRTRTCGVYQQPHNKYATIKTKGGDMNLGGKECEVQVVGRHITCHKLITVVISQQW